MQQSFWLTMEDNHPMYVSSWQPKQRPKAVIQIAHGMEEHIQRYNDFAEFLVSHHIAVYGNDHRGHGQTGLKSKELGYFGSAKGFEQITKDCIFLTDWIKEKHPDLPIFLLGHSMGSFVSRRYLTITADHLQGAILMGTGFQPNVLLSSGKLVAKLIGVIKGKRAKARFLNRLTFFGYNKRTAGKTAVDWLCSDHTVIQDYLKDPLCGFVPTNRFFYDLYDGLQSIQSKELAAHIPKDFPLLFLSGKEDPVGSYGKGVKQAVSFYRNTGLKYAEYTLYPNARHELLNEFNKTEVFQDILNWVEKRS